MSFETEFTDELAELTATLHADNEVESHNENWLVSYADMMTLLFGFFAMLYLMDLQVKQTEQPPPPPPPRAAQVPAPMTPVPKVESAKSDVQRKSETGGNRGFNVLDYLPVELLQLFALIAVLYFFFYRWGERRRRLTLLYTREARVPAPRLPLARAQAAASGAPSVDMDFFPDEPEEAGDGHGSVGVTLTDERWLISYADLMTLLFGFFAMLYLMGGDFNAIKKSMDDTFTKGKKTEESATSLEERTKLPVSIDNATLKFMYEAMKEPVATPIQPPPPPAIQPLVVIPVTPVPPKPTEAANVPRTMTLEELKKRDEEQLQALRDRFAKGGGAAGGAGQGQNAAESGGTGAAGAGQGGGGLGGGQGSGVGSGTMDADGSTICDSTAAMSYRTSCGGSGFFGCVSADDLSRTGGMNGNGGAIEFYCVGGITRLCLTWEKCPWRVQDTRSGGNPSGLTNTAASPASMTCSPYGLEFSGGTPALFAECRNPGTCGFSTLNCDPNGQLTVQP
jgi:flagellar motor protein MotB